MTSRLNFRNLLALAILVLAGTLAVVVVRNYRGATPEEILESLPRNVDLSLQKINYTETSEGKPRWTLVADSAAHNVGEGITRIENIHMTFYDEQNGDMVLTAEKGEMDSASRDVTVRGNVAIVGSRKWALYTEHLQYRAADRTIRNAEPVRLLSETMEVSGVGMRLDVRNRSLRLLSKVEARLSAIAGNGKR